LKIAYISKADRTGGGASLVAEELTSIFNRNGHEAHHYFALGVHDTNDRIPLHGSRPKLNMLFRKAQRLSKLMGLPEIVPIELIFLLYKGRILQYDIVHFHDLSAAVSPLTLAIISLLKPTIWTVHDCSPFTGGCLYPMDCNRYKKRCYNCPQLGNWPIDTRIDLTDVMRRIKRKIIENLNITLVAPSSWMVNMIAQSGLRSAQPVMIPNGINTREYHALDKKNVRNKLGIPLDRFVVLIIAAFLEDERKGINYAFDALRKIKSINPYLLLVGNINDDFKQKFKNFDCKITGFIRNDKEKVNYFSASDVFLFCSLADNMPLVVLETMATGTPTIGFQTGGVPEMIQHNKSGYLVKPKDTNGLGFSVNSSVNKTINKTIVKLSFHYQFFLHHIKNPIGVGDRPCDQCVKNIKTNHLVFFDINILHIYLLTSVFYMFIYFFVVKC